MRKFCEIGALFSLLAVSSFSFTPLARSRISRPSLVRTRGSENNANPWTQFVEGIQGALTPAKSPLLDLEYMEEIVSAQEVLAEAATTKTMDSETVVDTLLGLEKNMRKKCKDDESCGTQMLEKLNGAWRLVFTTGTIDTQKKIKGRVNYFPLKAVQSFDTSTMQLTNGIYVGDFAVVKFFGPFEFNVVSRKLEFDFDTISLGGFKIPLGKGGAAEIGSATGLGSDNNKKLVESGKKPFFNWVSCDDEIATARGGGGGLALWKRDIETEALILAENSR